jgi:hypothetical protein
MLHVAVLVTVSLEPTAPRPTVDLVQLTPAPPRTTNFAAPPRRCAEVDAEAEWGAAESSATVARIPAALRVMWCIVVPLIYMQSAWYPPSQDLSEVTLVEGAFASRRNKGSNTMHTRVTLSLFAHSDLEVPKGQQSVTTMAGLPSKMAITSCGEDNLTPGFRHVIQVFVPVSRRPTVAFHSSR